MSDIHSPGGGDEPGKEYFGGLGIASFICPAVHYGIVDSVYWLNPHLGYVKTSHAKEKIRQWFKKQKRAENIENGRALLEKELKQLGVKIERQDLAGLFYYSHVDDFLAAIGYGGITRHQIALKLAAQHEEPKATSEVTLPKPVTSGVQVFGVGELVTHLAQCCHPVPGDTIIGYITRSRGVTIHRQDCHNVVNEDETERLISVEWGETDSLYPVKIQVEAWDRVGLMRDITTVIAEEKINIAAVSFVNNDDQTTVTTLTLETSNLAQLGRLLAKVEGVKGVINASRIWDGASPKASPEPDAAHTQ